MTRVPFFFSLHNTSWGSSIAKQDTWIAYCDSLWGKNLCITLSSFRVFSRLAYLVGSLMKNIVVRDVENGRRG